MVTLSSNFILYNVIYDNNVNEFISFHFKYDCIDSLDVFI